jgi:hypothetical protein
MTRSSLQKVLIAVAVAAIVPTMTACPKKPVPAVADAEPPQVVVDAAPNVLEPLGDDAGVDAADAAHHAGGNWKPQDPLVQRITQCCSALAKQSKENGNPPELASAVLTCNSTAAQLKSNPNAPELNALRPLLKMVKNLPALCAGI